ncbi:MFS multidrug transporter [Pleurostoma richardsiae]|uniref:MFS multidrug transporter n=1 Tax=Pleurostoma richardsiae TaxID=41990 RepID=A0AA38VBV6_9PEZI|nr:MFS multidrug transporter [Pleurostoma richardsiae]
MDSKETLPVTEDHPGSSTEDEMPEKTDPGLVPGVAKSSDPDTSDGEVPSTTDGLHPNEQTGAQEPEYITGVKLHLIIFAITLCCFLMLLDSSILSTAVPVITNDFHALEDIGWYVSAYQLALSALQPLTGKFFTYFSLKWTFLVFFGLFELGSLLCGVAVSSKMLIIGRAVAGLGGSGLYNGGMTIIVACLPLQKRPTVTGIVMGCAQLGLIAGPLVGGALTEFTTWRWCFYINLPIGGLAAILLAVIHIPDQTEKQGFKAVVTDPNVWHKFDLTGSLLFVPAVVMLLLALHFGGGEYAWDSATVIGLFCGFGGALAVFLAWEWRAGEDAMVPLSMIRKQVVWASSLSGMFMFSSMFCITYFIPVFFQAILGATPVRSGVYMLPTMLSQLIAGVSSGFLVSKFGYYLPWLAFSGVALSISNGLMSTFTASTATGQWIGYQILHGVGRGTGIQMPLLAVQSALPVTQVSVGIALNVFIQNLGSAIFISAANTIFDGALKSQLVEKAPGVDAEAVIAAGATGFRKFVPSADLPGVLSAYATSVDRVFYLAAGLAVAAFATSWGTGWNDVRKKKAAAVGEV